MATVNVLRTNFTEIYKNNHSVKSTIEQLLQKISMALNNIAIPKLGLSLDNV